ncbi:LysR family transcriptional regulator [Caldimonas thermodepolymerans]|jgi:LysR family transcriptional regulator of gallate degradation|uniref:DNA-binding transcriptional LysR family regulator n=1 Tax=Caldimonas thermodepolymerans TaxID=215580 RepID=A0AA46DFI2_9BURK|nr:LysR family transcriptional regulator [Caldimonas thermodepolymerans]TCP08320.1 DNA-binding transcriptional LysR family regulator [Caldimonas thermodepolymerans]UZG48567.1 LysR family transcriptional regulator [Caldimonas thermodepolymerans]
MQATPRQAAGSRDLTPFDLNLRHLRGLLAVQDHGSISAACSEVGLSQPALTQGILKLEQQLGQPLFDRRPDGMVPTVAGEQLIQRVRACLDHLAHGVKFMAVNGFEPDRRMSMTQIRALLAVVKAGSLAQAALDLDLSQPAVHRAVRELESTLGRRLVERRGRGVQVNFLGKRFARACRLAVKELQAAFTELGLDAHDPVIAVGTTPLVRAFLVPEGIATMLSEHAHASFRVLEGSWSELVEHLRDGLIDLVVGEIPDTQVPGLATVPLYGQAPVIVSGHQHPLARAPAVPVRELRHYPWIIAPEGSPLRTQWETLFRPTLPATPVECGSIMILGRLLTSSESLSLAMPDQIALQIRSGLLARIAANVHFEPCTIGVTLLEGWKPTAAQSRFIETLRTVSHAALAESPRPARIESAWV